MIENDADGQRDRLQGRASASTSCATRTGTSRTDFKPAYLDEIDMPQGNDDTSVASRKILDRPDMITGDFSPPPAILKQATTQRRTSSCSCRRRRGATSR